MNLVKLIYTSITALSLVGISLMCPLIDTTVLLRSGDKQAALVLLHHHRRTFVEMKLLRLPHHFEAIEFVHTLCRVHEHKS